MMTPLDGHGRRLQSRVRGSIRTLFLWTVAWLLTTALLAFGPEMVWDETRGVTFLALGLNIAVGIGMILANKGHLQALDELHRKVMLDAMGITLGVTLIAGVPYSLLDVHEVLAFDSEIAALYVLMSLTFMASLALGLRRYQ